MVKDESQKSYQAEKKLGLNRKAVFLPMILILAVNLLGSIVFSLYVLPDEYSIGYIYIALLVVIGVVYLVIKAIPFYWLENRVKSFLDLDNVQKLTYGRLMMCLGELFIASSILAIAIGFASTLDMPFLRIVAFFTVFLVVIMVSFSVVSLLLQCFPHGSEKYFRYQVMVGLMLLLVSQAIITFGVYSGKGISEFYALKHQISEQNI